MPRDDFQALRLENRRIHDGRDTGPVWQAVLFLTGVLPTLFAVTGVVMWLRRRRNRRTLEQRRAAAVAVR